MFRKIIIKKEIVELPYEVTRHQLGSISKDDIQYLKKMSQEERAEHIENIAKIYSNPSFKQEVESLIDTQVYWMAEQSDGGRQHDFGKGTVNGMSLILERFQQLYGEHREANKPEEKAEDPHSVI